MCFLVPMGITWFVNQHIIHICSPLFKIILHYIPFKRWEIRAILLVRWTRYSFCSPMWSMSLPSYKWKVTHYHAWSEKTNPQSWVKSLTYTWLPKDLICPLCHHAQHSYLLQDLLCHRETNLILYLSGYTS